MASADFLLRFVVLLAPTNDCLIFGWLMFPMILVASAIRIAHAFQMISKAHFDSVAVVRHSIVSSGTLDHVADSQVHVHEFLERRVNGCRFAHH
jgi:hypothetical protein